MPYIGVSTVLSAAKMMRHREAFVQTLGVETIHDLIELKQSDLAQIGLEASFPRLKQELDRILGGNGPAHRVENKFQQRRRVAKERILALGGNASLPLLLEAAGATFYDARLAALGVQTPADLHLLKHDDLAELGMQVLHARRFLAAVRLAPRVDDAFIARAALQSMASAVGGHEGARAHWASSTASPSVMPSSSLCSLLLQPMGLGSYCTRLLVHPGGKPSHAVPLSVACGLRVLDLERARMRLVQRRRMWRAVRALVPSMCAAGQQLAMSGRVRGGARADGGEPPAEGTSPPIQDRIQPPRRGAASELDTHLLDGCFHVFLDVGANVGINHHHLFRWKAPHHQYRHGAMQPAFDRYFGHTKAARRASVCSVGIEANPNHSPSLLALSSMHHAHGIRTDFLTETAAASTPGTVSFHLQNLTKSGRAIHEWGASVYSSAVNRGQGVPVTVRAIDLADWVRRVVLQRQIPEAPPRALLRGNAGADASMVASGGLSEGMLTSSVVMKVNHARSPRAPAMTRFLLTHSRPRTISGLRGEGCSLALSLSCARPLSSQLFASSLLLPSPPTTAPPACACACDIFIHMHAMCMYAISGVSWSQMDIEGSEFAVLSRLLSSGVLCQLDAIAIEWHDERAKGTRPIHAATGAPTNFSGLLSYAVASSRQPALGNGGAKSVVPGCAVELVDLKVDGT
jgi:hypothetical protein